MTDRLRHEMDRVARKDRARQENPEGHAVALFLLGGIAMDMTRVSKDPNIPPKIAGVAIDADVEGDIDSIIVTTDAGHRIKIEARVLLEGES